MQEQPAVFDAFLGTWSVRRKIVDYRSGGIFSFEGKAVLTNTSFEEQGQIDYGDSIFSAERAYKIQADGDSISVLFPNGARFIELGSAVSQAVYHYCGQDTYIGRFYFRGRETWAERWRVSGPRKHYASLAHYRR
jgi:hypothetical protein